MATRSPDESSAVRSGPPEQRELNPDMPRPDGHGSRGDHGTGARVGPQFDTRSVAVPGVSSSDAWEEWSQLLSSVNPDRRSLNIVAGIVECGLAILSETVDFRPRALSDRDLRRFFTILGDARRLGEKVDENPELRHAREGARSQLRRDARSTPSEQRGAAAPVSGALSSMRAVDAPSVEQGSSAEGTQSSGEIIGAGEPQFSGLELRSEDVRPDSRPQELVRAEIPSAGSSPESVVRVSEWLRDVRQRTTNVRRLSIASPFASRAHADQFHVSSADEAPNLPEEERDVGDPRSGSDEVARPALPIPDDLLGSEPHSEEPVGAAGSRPRDGGSLTGEAAREING